MSRLKQALSPILAGLFLAGTAQTPLLAYENLQSMGSAVDNFCANNMATTGCNSYLSASPQMQLEYLAQITPDTLTALYQSTIDVNHYQLMAINTHLTNQRQRVFARHEDTTTNHDQNFNLFVNGAQSDSNLDTSPYQPAHELDVDYATIGAYWPIDQEWLIGMALGSSESDIEYGTFSDPTHQKTDHLMLFSSWYRKSFALDTVLGYSSAKVETTRQLPDADVTGRTDARTLYFSLTGAFDFNQGAWAYGPIASLEYMDGKIDAFSEAQTSTWSASFDSQDINSLIYSIGAQTSYATGLSWATITPFASAVWRYQFKDKRTGIDGQLNAGNPQTFSISAESPDVAWYEVEAGISAEFSQQVSVLLSYHQVLHYRDTETKYIAAGVALNW